MYISGKTRGQQSAVRSENGDVLYYVETFYFLMFVAESEYKLEL